MGIKIRQVIRWFLKIWRPAIDSVQGYKDHRYIVLANRISIIILLSVVLFECIIWLTNAVEAEKNFPLLCPFIILILVPWLNYKKHHDAGRILLSHFLPLYLLCVGVYENYLYPQELSRYYDPRIALLLCAVIPFLLFGMRKWIPLASSLSLSAVGLFFYNPLLSLFGGGFVPGNIDLSSYHSSDASFALTFIILSIMALSLKSLQEKTEKIINDKNSELHDVNNEILAQNEEILMQTEVLKLSEDKLFRSNVLIEEQYQRLEALNETLENTLREKSSALESTNEELVKYNNELLQFSFTVSHNLRGPVARLIGLTNLMDLQGGTPEIYSRIKTSSFELENVLKDLSKIIDIRNEMYRIREKIYFQEEWEKIKGYFSEQLGEGDFIEVNFTEAPWIISIRPLVNSILYNFVSNAVKYRSFDKNLNISIKTRSNNSVVTLSVSDNGLGINLANHKKDLFKLYKRFHIHKEGKGVGLYLVKTQAEILGGWVDVSSVENKGSTFSAHFKTHDERKIQLFMSEAYATISYHAWLNTLEFKWTTDPTLEEFKNVYDRGQHVVTNYKATNLILDIRNRLEIKDEEQLYALEKIFPSLFKAGIQKVLIIQTPEKVLRTRPEVMARIGSESRFAMVSSYEEAIDIIQRKT